MWCRSGDRKKSKEHHYQLAKLHSDNHDTISIDIKYEKHVNDDSH